MYPYFQYVNIPNLKIVQEELWSNYDQVVSHSEQYTSSYKGSHDLNGLKVFLIDKDLLLSKNPALTQYLTDITLIDHLKVTAFVEAKHGSPNKVHRDGTFQNAMNIPIHNCQDGYTLWFNPVPDEELVGGMVGKTTGSFFIDNPGDPVAKARVSNPQWFNTFIPHTSVNESNGTRFSLSLRFGKTWDMSLHKLTEFYEDN